MKKQRIRIHYYACRCRFCGYWGTDWPDSGECPSCGEVN
jgi:rubrerythrin